MLHLYNIDEYSNTNRIVVPNIRILIFGIRFSSRNKNIVSYRIEFMLAIHSPSFDVTFLTHFKIMVTELKIQCMHHSDDSSFHPENRE